MITAIDTYTSRSAQATAVTITQHFTPQTVKQAKYFSYAMGTYLVDLEIGLRDKLSGDWLGTETISIPAKRLLHGKTFENLRTIRLNHLINIISSVAGEVLNVDLNNTQVIFIGLRTG